MRFLVRVATNLRAAVAAAVGDIADAMTGLRATMTASAAAASGASWNGLNRERFLDAHQDFDRSMARAEEATSSAFTDLSASIEQLTSAIEQYTATLGVSLGSAVDAAESMAGAVEQQRANLDQVMNQGLGIA